MHDRIYRLLAAAALLAGGLAAGMLTTQAMSDPGKAAFDEIDVKRINVREDDGTLRLVISNQGRFPGIIRKGKEHPHPDRYGAGVLFYNDEGTESGGLVFAGGRLADKIVNTGHLSFDQYEQDQVVQITHYEEAGRRYAVFQVTDRPDQPMDLSGKDAASLAAATRVRLGRTRDRSSSLTLHDAAGRPRMVLEVTAEGTASIEFLDESGEAVRTLAPDA